MPGLIPEATPFAGGGGMADPFGMANQLMEFQIRSNQNRQFQTQFMANQALGEIMAHAASPEEGMAAAESNPLITGFAGQALQNLRSIQMLRLQSAQTQQQIGRTGMEMTQSGYLNTLSALGQAVQDPLNTDKYINSALNSVDPSVRGNVAQQVRAVQDAIHAKLSGYDLKDPAQLEKAKNEVASLAGGAFVLAGGDPSHLAAMFPSLEVTPEGIPIVKPPMTKVITGAVPYVAGTGAAPAGTGPAGGPQGPQPVPVNNSADPSLPPVNAAADVSHMIATDPGGRPIISLKTGTPSLKPGFQKLDDDLKTKFADETHSYTAATNMISGLNQMDQATDALTKSGGIATPGFLGEARSQLMSAIQAFQNVTGKEFNTFGLTPDELSKDVMDATSLKKWHNVITFNMKNMLESTGARGLGVLMEAEGAVPGIDNSPLAIKLLTAELKAMASWQVGKYEFKNAYMQNNPVNTLVGADEAYNRSISPTDLANKQLAGFNMQLSHDGQLVFRDKAALDKAAGDGLLGEGDAGKALYKEFYKKLYPNK